MHCSSSLPAEAATSPPTAPAEAGKKRKRSGPKSRSSPYKGVSLYKNAKYEAHIWIPASAKHGKGHQRHIGSFETAEEAARAFDMSTLRVRGQDEELNFPYEQYVDNNFWKEHKHLDKWKFLDAVRMKLGLPPQESPIARHRKITKKKPVRTSCSGTSTSISAISGAEKEPCPKAQRVDKRETALVGAGTMLPTFEIDKDNARSPLAVLDASTILFDTSPTLKQEHPITVSSPLLLNLPPPPPLAPTPPTIALHLEAVSPVPAPSDPFALPLDLMNSPLALDDGTNWAYEAILDDIDGFMDWLDAMPPI